MTNQRSVTGSAAVTAIAMTSGSAAVSDDETALGNNAVDTLATAAMLAVVVPVADSR